MRGKCFVRPEMSIKYNAFQEFSRPDKRSASGNLHLSSVAIRITWFFIVTTQIRCRDFAATAQEKDYAFAYPFDLFYECEISSAHTSMALSFFTFHLRSVTNRKCWYWPHGSFSLFFLMFQRSVIAMSRLHAFRPNENDGSFRWA